MPFIELNRLLVAAAQFDYFVNVRKQTDVHCAATPYSSIDDSYWEGKRYRDENVRSQVWENSPYNEVCEVIF
jgi:hypothetical protein